MDADAMMIIDGKLLGWAVLSPRGYVSNCCKYHLKQPLEYAVFRTNGYTLVSRIYTEINYAGQLFSSVFQCLLTQSVIISVKLFPSA
jgi:hypothetical protein